MSFLQTWRQRYKICMDSENLPNMLRAAALLLKRWNDISIPLGSPAIILSASLHTLKHYFGWFYYKSKNVKY